MPNKVYIIGVRLTLLRFRHYNVTDKHNIYAYTGKIVGKRWTLFASTSPQISQPALRALCCGTLASRRSVAQVVEPSGWRWMPASLWPLRARRPTAAAGGHPRTPDTALERQQNTLLHSVESLTRNGLNKFVPHGNELPLRERLFSQKDSCNIFLLRNVKRVGSILLR